MLTEQDLLRLSQGGRERVWKRKDDVERGRIRREKVGPRIEGKRRG